MHLLHLLHLLRVVLLAHLACSALSAKERSLRGGRRLWRVGVMFFSALSISLSPLLINESHAQIDVGLTSGLDAVPAARLRSGVWLGAGVSNGRVQLSSPQALVKGRVDLMPMVLLGADLWTSEAYGFAVRGSFGLNAQLTLPPQYGAQSLAYRQHHALMGALRRWHLSDSPDSITLSAGLGLRVQIDETPPQRPTFLVNRSALGPALLLGAMLPISDSLWLNGRASASTHVLVREDPADSGGLDSSLTLEAALEGCARLSELLSVVVDVEWRHDKVSFTGFGTRALGVYNAETSQIFWTAGAALRVAIQ